MGGCNSTNNELAKLKFGKLNRETRSTHKRLIKILIRRILLYFHQTPNLLPDHHRFRVMAPAAAVRELAFVGATAVDQPCTTT